MIVLSCGFWLRLLSGSCFGFFGVLDAARGTVRYPAALIWQVVTLAVLVAARVLTFGLRAVPTPAVPGRWWTVAALLAVTVVFCAGQLLTYSQQIVVRRDPASYFNFATWLAGHGSLPIHPALQAFGGADPAQSIDSPANFERGGVLWPQFMAGTPMVLAPV